MTTYAGQMPSANSSSSPCSQTQCFSVVADTDPAALPRVLEVFAKLTLVPSQCHSVQVGAANDELHIDLQFANMDQETATHLARSLRGLHLVGSVLTSEKRERLSA
jgi:hypothetical protein